MHLLTILIHLLERVDKDKRVSSSSVSLVDLVSTPFSTTLDFLFPPLFIDRSSHPLISLISLPIQSVVISGELQPPLLISHSSQSHHQGKVGVNHSVRILLSSTSQCTLVPIIDSSYSFFSPGYLNCHVRSVTFSIRFLRLNPSFLHFSSLFPPFPPLYSDVVMITLTTGPQHVTSPGHSLIFCHLRIYLTYRVISDLLTIVSPSSSTTIRLSPYKL